MFIREIELNNFRIYKGENKIQFSPTSERNIAVISGKNGFGKTTFLMSLVWCLYGKQMQKVDELYQKEISDKGGYGKYIGNSLNRLAKVQGETQFSVSVTFNDVKIQEIPCKEIKITRSYDTITSTSDKVEVLVDGRENELILDLTTDSQQGEEIFIRDYILPIEIAKFFFFDAEKIVALAEINSPEQRRLLSKAYTEVLGIKKYEDLKEKLESIQDDYRKKSAKPEEKTELNSIIADIDNTDIEIEAVENEVQQLDDEKIEKSSQANEIQRKLIQGGNKMTLEQLNKLKFEETELTTQINELQDQLKDLFELIPFGLAGATLMEISNHLDKETTQRKSKFIQEDVDEKTKLLLDDLEEKKKGFPTVITTDIRRFYEEQITALVKKHFFKETSDISKSFQPLHDFSDTETNELNSLINNLKHSFKSSFTSMSDEYFRAKNQLDSIRRKIRDAEKDAEDEYIANLRSEKETLDKRVLKIENEIRDLKEKIGSIKNDKKTLKQRQEELRKKIDNSRKYSEKDAKAKEIISRLKNFIKAFKEEKKKSLQENILQELSTLLHKKDFIKKVTVDINQSGDDVDISIFNSRDEKIDKGSLSMGERQMYASALLKALVDESDIEFPVFIDSPVQKFDADHAQSVIEEFYPNVSEQVIIFPLLEGELTEPRYNLLKNKINRAYLINNYNPEGSEFIETSANKLFQTYIELNAN